MLGKLLKYEFKSTARLFLPLLAAILVLSGLNRLMFVTLSKIDVHGIANGIITLTYVFMIIATFIMTIVVMIQRFYKNLLGEEGYLSMTLPVSVSNHILCKLITSSTWIVLTIIVTLVSIFITIPDYSFLKELPSIISIASDQFREIAGVTLGSFIGALIPLMLVGIISAILMIYTAISFGQISNKRKILTSFGAYLAIYSVIQAINLVLLSIVGMSLDNNPITNFPIEYIWYMIILELVYITGFFFTTKYLLKNKLNLE